MAMITSGFAFETQHQDGEARAGILTTPRAQIQTPVFMPVGTQASVKALEPHEVLETGASLILANTYHLWLRPGPEIVEAMGGIHRFMAWPGAVLTDSGGFQVFSLARLRKVSDEGVVFRSHLSGEEKSLTPEEAMRVQACIGSDIAMVLDECPPADATVDILEMAVQRSTAWAKRSLAAQSSGKQARFVIVQGGTNLALRHRHLQELSALPSDGIALGGLSVGEPIERMYEVLQEIAPNMPYDRPRYLMGVGTPYDLLTGIQHGIDMFDCVLPTRNARNGQALTWSGRVNLKQARHTIDAGPVDPQCSCAVCDRYSRAYLRHLFVAGEMLGPKLVSQHNLHFYADLMKGARAAIRQGTYTQFHRATVDRMRQGDEVGQPT